MAKKNASLFVCQQCGNESAKWAGTCSYCGEWNSLTEVSTARLQGKSRKPIRGGSSGRPSTVKPIKVSEVTSQQSQRFSTGFEELDRVFGESTSTSGVKKTQHPVLKSAGIVPGSVTLLSGEPGMGKSTLLSQLALKLNLESINSQTTLNNKKQIPKNKSKKTEKLENSKILSGVLYVCGEESPDQVKMRLERLSSTIENLKLGNLESISLLPEIVCENIVDHLLKNSNKYQLVIIDSIQSIISDQLNSFAGSVSQVRECGLQLTQTLKQIGIAGIIVGHVTKGGNIAGPKTLEHMVDAVFRIEGERTHDLRLVRSLKNRFGTTDEVGVFRMTDQGLQEITNAADVFLENVQTNQPGSVVTAILEGNRVILLEIQALVVRSNLAVPRRVTNGIKVSRLQMILAVLQKQLNLKLGEMDVFINVAGGVSIKEPAADLAVAAAVISSIKNQPISISKANKDKQKTSTTNNRVVVFGEMGLLGEIRPVIGSDKRTRTAKKLGYHKIVGPDTSRVKNMLKLTN